jgi:hypothetical protein
MTLRRVALLGLVALALAGAPAASAASPPEPPSFRSAPRPAAGGAAIGAIAQPAPSELDLPIVVDTATVLVRAQPGMEGAARDAATRLPATVARIAADLDGLPAPARIEIRLVREAADLARVAPPGRGAPPWASGVAWPDLGVLAVATRRGAEPIDLASTLDHELAHLLLGAALGGRAPRWLDEGFAYLHSAEWSFGRTSALTGMAWSGDALPLGELDRGFRGPEDQASRAYAQAYDLTAFLARRGRHADAEDDGDRWPFRDFLAALAAGQGLDEAGRTAFAASMRDLYREWYQGLRQRYLMVPLELFTAAIWLIAAALLFAGFVRRRRRARATLAQWGDEEDAHLAAAASSSEPATPTTT